MTTGKNKTMENLKNRKGIVTVHKDLLHEFDAGILKVFFSNFYPTHIERTPFDDNYRYFGVSEHFKEIKEGYKIPKYNPVLTRHENGELTIKFEFTIDLSDLII